MLSRLDDTMTSSRPRNQSIMRLSVWVVAIATVSAWGLQGSARCRPRSTAAFAARPKEVASDSAAATVTHTEDLEAKDTNYLTTMTIRPVGSEPSVLDKLVRRIRVFGLAGRVFLSYKIVQFQESRLRQRLGLPADAHDDEDEEHPAVTQLWDAAHTRNAQRLYDGMADLQGFWIKVGQYLSTRADVMPRPYLQILAQLSDGVPAKPWSDVNATLQQALSMPLVDSNEKDSDSHANKLILEHVDTTPLSTASLAQVHRATIVDPTRGQPRDVVLKVQHRGVAELMRQDMENLRTLLNMLRWSDPTLDYTQVVQEYTAEVTRELDFRLEAQNMQLVKSFLQDQQIRAIVPETVWATEKVLVMEYCPGFSIRDVEKLDAHGIDRFILLERVCQAWAAQMHRLGTFNADPHAGNILVSTVESNTPVLLDFGLTKRLSPSIQVAFSRMVYAAYETDVDGLLQSFDEMGLQLNRYDPFEDMAAMQSSLADPVPQSQAVVVQKDRARERQAKNEAMRQEQGLKKGQKLRNPVDAWPSELIFFSRVTAMLRGLCSRLEVSYPYLACMAQASSETLRQAVPVHERATNLVYAPVPHENAELQSKLSDIAQELLQEKQAVGLQTCVIQNGEVIANVAAGTLGTVNSRPVTPSSLFNVFSVSKAVLATGVLVLLNEYKISVDDPIAKFWPAFGESHPWKKQITIRQALSHQSGLANAFPDDVSIDTLTDWEKMKAYIASAEAVPCHLPGEETQYHYLSFAWILGGLIEEVTGEPYERFLEKHLINPLGLSKELHMGGLPDYVEMERLAVLTARTLQSEHNQSKATSTQRQSQNAHSSSRLEKFRGRQQLMNPSVFNMRKVRAAKLPSANGHASAHALASLMDALISQNERLDGPLLPNENLREARTPQKTSVRGSSVMLDNAGASFGLGFQVHNVRLPDGREVHSIGHAGFGGSIVIGIPEMNLSIAVTTNQLSVRSVARAKLLDGAFQGLGLQAPQSLLDG